MPSVYVSILIFMTPKGTKSYDQSCGLPGVCSLILLQRNDFKCICIKKVVLSVHLHVAPLQRPAETEVSLRNNKVGEEHIANFIVNVRANSALSLKGLFDKF